MREVSEEVVGVRVDSALREVRGLINRRDYAAAAAAAEDALRVFSNHRDLLYMRAVALRYSGRITEALRTLEQLQDFHPEYPRLYQERGHCYIGLREPESAIAAFEEAVRRNASLPGSWNALVRLYQVTGREAQAAEAAAQVNNLASLPKEIVTAFSMYCDGEIFEAEKLVRHYLRTHGDHVEGMRLLAKIGVDLDIVDDAVLLLSRLLEMAPGHHVARYEYAIALLRQHRHVEALAQIDRLLALNPVDRGYRITRAAIQYGMGDCDSAIPLYRQLIAETPTDPELHQSLGHAYKSLGDQPASIESYRGAIAVAPQFGEAYWSLANLKTYRFTDLELDAMRRQEAAPRIRLEDRYHLCFALGKALEDRGDYAESFRYYERGNALKEEESRYRPEVIERNTKLQIEVCTEDFFASRQGWGCADPAPIFVVGLPRSGSTLLEQILASHSMVEGTMELADIPRLAGDLQGRLVESANPRYPANLADLTEAQVRELGERYINETRAYRSGKPFFIDKMPNNFRHLGLIRLILPNAKIIDARREPMACCFSNFKQLFASGQQFTYSFEHIARYYRTYVELMRHWDLVLPGRILRVEHEAVIEDLEGSVRRILDFCGLPYEPACVEFHKTERSVHTASSEQVRRPINRDGVDQWRNFEAHLGPLKAALGELLAPA